MVGAGTDYSHLADLKNMHCIEFMLGNLNIVFGDVSFLKKRDGIYVGVVGCQYYGKIDYAIQVKNTDYMMCFLNGLNVKRVIISDSASEFAYSDVIDGKNAPSPSDYYSTVKVFTGYLCGKFDEYNGMDVIYKIISSVYGSGNLQ